jgi:hypothetical protein
MRSKDEHSSCVLEDPLLEEGIAELRRTLVEFRCEWRDESSVKSSVRTRWTHLADLGVSVIFVIGSAPVPDRLPPRLFRVGVRLARGLCPKAIARELGLSVNTVRKYVDELYKALSVNSRVDLARCFLFQVEQPDPCRHDATAPRKRCR